MKFDPDEISPAEREYRCPRCKAVHGADWWPGVPAKGWAGRWCAPQLDPCSSSSCTAPEESSRHGEALRLMTIAGFPRPLIGYSFTRCERQGPTEELGAFRERVTRARGSILGMTTANVRVMEALDRWRPGGKRETLVLYGPPGTGKTTSLAAMAYNLSNVKVGTRRVPLTVEEVGSAAHLARLEACGRGFRIASSRPSPCKYIRLEEVCDAQRLRDWRADPESAKQLSNYSGVLFLDEIGINDEPDKIELEAVQMVVGYRIDRGLPTVIATNRTPGDLRDARVPLYGARVASRLHRAAWLPLVGADWRES